MKRPRGPRPLLTILTGAFLVAWVPVPGSAQASRPGSLVSEHVCGDCHGPHVNGGRREAMVRSGRSEVASLAPGVGPVTVRCLQCHGTEGDRQQARSDRQIPVDAPEYLGKNLLDDHPLGWAGPVAAMGLPTTMGARIQSTSRLLVLRDDYDPDAAVECGSCHDPHEPGLIGQQSVTQVATCLTCHDPGMSLGSHGSAPCGTCHRMHTAPGRDHLGRERVSDLLCGACHDGAPEPLNPGMDRIAGQPLHIDPSDTRCVDCHVVHASPLIP